MKLLIITQRVDPHDENLGFFCSWIHAFANHYDEVVVIGSFCQDTAFPSHVVVHSLGKENGTSYVHRIWKFWELFSEHYAGSDAVFFHMIPEFAVAALPFMISVHRPSALWYTHKSVTWKLRIAERLVDYVFTASPLSFRLPSKKVIYTGHAIDTDGFVPKRDLSHRGGLHMLTTGRISPVKDIETILRACLLLKTTWDQEWTLSIVGGPLLARDHDYLATLKEFVVHNDLSNRVSFHGALPHTEIAALYQEHDMFLSMSTTGSIDKSVLEAMSMGLSVITANEAFQSLLPQQYFLMNRGPEMLAERIKSLASEDRPNRMLRDLVVEHHGLQKTIARIIHMLAHINSSNV